MSSALAIAAVTAAIKDLLNDGMLDHDLSSLGSFTISAQPPDRVVTGGTENNQLNLFLYQVTPNLGWRNVDLPSRDRTGQRLSSPPLALDLHYLLTAYGAQDMNAEILLGYAMQVLHETPVLTREQLRIALGAPSPVDGSLLPGPFGALSAVDLADQSEQIKITPVFLGSEDLSKLWTAMQARYRPSMAYAVSVVLIQGEAGGRRALPVLKRGRDDRGPFVQAGRPPWLAGVQSAASPMQAVVRLGDDLVLSGGGLLRANATQRLELPRYGLARAIDPAPLAGVPDTDARRGAHLPGPSEDATAMDGWLIGVYGASLRFADPGQPPWDSNSVPVAIAPLIGVAPLAQPAGTVSLQVTCTPRLRDEQQPGVRLLFGALEVRPDTVTTPADTSKPTVLAFTIPGVAVGSYPVRLRVDGIDSVPATLSGTPPRLAFDAQQTVVVS